ncbi:MAG: peptidase [Bdellovibrionaceae bacterium]|nr:peptidase [Pseudobdellovibrionaceae bacterium]
MAKSKTKKKASKSKSKPKSKAAESLSRKKNVKKKVKKKLSDQEQSKIKKAVKKKTPGLEEDMFDSDIVIDEERGLVFGSEDELYNFFRPQIDQLEVEYEKFYRPNKDFNQKDYEEYEEQLLELLQEPDQIYEDEYRLPGVPVKQYVKEFEHPELGVYHYVALVYLAVDTPTFVFLHFPTRDPQLLNNYTKGQLFYDKEKGELEIEEVDALTEGDELAVGLFKAMQTLRSDNDIPTHEFQDYMDYRSEAIEEADEIWRTTDYSGNVLVNFIKDYSEAEAILYYISVAVEDAQSDSHYLLFSFPTRDSSLVDRYRHGENLQAEESGIDDDDSH